MCVRQTLANLLSLQFPAAKGVQRNPNEIAGYNLVGTDADLFILGIVKISKGWWQVKQKRIETTAKLNT